MIPTKRHHVIVHFRLDVPKSTLMDGKLRIDESDIYFSTGLPMGSVPIVESKVRENSDEHKKMISDWKK